MKSKWPKFSNSKISNHFLSCIFINKSLVNCNPQFSLYFDRLFVKRYCNFKLSVFLCKTSYLTRSKSAIKNEFHMDCPNLATNLYRQIYIAIAISVPQLIFLRYNYRTCNCNHTLHISMMQLIFCHCDYRDTLNHVGNKSRNVDLESRIPLARYARSRDLEKQFLYRCSGQRALVWF